MGSLVLIPVTHEFDAFLKFEDDLKIQQALIGLFTIHKGDFSIGEGADKISVSSHLGNLINPETGERSFEYRIKLGNTEKVEASKFSLHIAGQFGPCKAYKKGIIVDVTRPFIGTQIRVQCSYYELDEIWITINEIFRRLKIGRKHLYTYFDEESKITQFARVIRYHHSHEANVCSIIGNIGELSRSTGVTQGHDFWDHNNGMVGMRKVNIESMDIVGIDHSTAVELKSYRIRFAHKRISTDPLYHPKLEISYDSKLTTTTGREQAAMEDYDMIKDELDEILFNVAHWAQVTQGIPDDYFKAERMESPVKFRKNILDDLVDLHANRADVAVAQASNNELLFLKAICDGLKTPTEIAKKLGLSIRTVYAYSTKYVEAGTLLHNYNELCFFSKAIRESTTNALNCLKLAIVHKAPMPEQVDTEVYDKHDPKAFEQYYKPTVIPGWKFKYQVHDPQGQLTYEKLMWDYEYHVQMHGVMYGEELPPIDGVGHSMDLVPHAPLGDVQPPIIVSSRREQTKAIKKLISMNIFRKVIRVSPLGFHPLNLDTTT